MTIDEPDYTHLAQVVKAFRVRAGLSQQDVASRGGPSDTTLSQIEAGAWKSARPGPTLRKLDKGLDWVPGSAEDVAFEGMPLQQIRTVASASPRAAAAPQLDPIASAWLAAFNNANPSGLSDDQLAQQIDVLNDSATQLSYVMQETEESLASLRIRHNETVRLLRRAEQERDFRDHAFQAPEVPEPVIEGSDLLSLASGAVLARDITLPNHDRQPDFVLITVDGRTIIVEVKESGSDSDLANAATELRMALVLTNGDPARRVHGVVVDARGEQGKYIVGILNQMLDHGRDTEPTESEIRQEVALEELQARADEDPWLAEAARDTGKPSRGQRDRDAASQAGEPPTDDPDDMEPR